nr:MAG TPA: hypothetical protein [Caudoviricetes sp.]
MIDRTTIRHLHHYADHYRTQPKTLPTRLTPQLRTYGN